MTIRHRRTGTPAGPLSGDLQAQLDELLLLSPDQLRDRWHKIYAHRASRAISTQKLARAIAFRLQAAHYGVEDSIRPSRGLSRISALTDGLGAPTVLRRYWDGQDHEVVKQGDAYLYAGQTYRSLSAVARAITGTRWNGWVFFGLKRPGDGAKGALDD